MATKTMFHKLRKALRACRAAQGGNVIITFALALIPVVGAIGAAVDFSHASSVKAAMQAALDSTALMLAKNVAGQNTTQMQEKANAYFLALFNRPEAKNVQVTVNYDPSAGSSLTLNGSAMIDTDFMGMMGFKQLTISTNATAAWGMSRLRVALALDNTGSMATSGKMTALKKASHNLLDMLKNAAQQNGDVYVSIIPFSKDVNVGNPTSLNATWIDWSYYDKSGGGGRDWDRDSDRDSDRDRDRDDDDEKKTDHSKWNGCVMDRDQDYDVKNTAPTTSIVSTLFPAEQYTSCPTELMPLGYDWVQLNKKIDEMTSAGYTNQAIGLAWAWHSLTQGDPLNAPAKSSSYQYQDVIILLSDGMNTQNRWTTKQSEIDARQQILCANIKKAGVTIYTVLVMSGNSTVLQNCASDPTKYFALTSANQIITTFNTIGTNLSKLRIAK